MMTPRSQQQKWGSTGWVDGEKGELEMTELICGEDKSSSNGGDDDHDIT